MNKIKFLLCFALLVSGVEGRGQIYINSYRFGAASTAELLLDSFGTGIQAAYSLRKLDKDYTGNCITIRRASNNDTLAIGFIGNELDTAAINTHCAGTTCTVRRWWDQSGNNNNAVQTDTAKQPIIYEAGAIVRLGGTGNKPAIRWDGVNDEINSTVTALSTASAICAFYVFSSNAAAAPNTNTAPIWTLGTPNVNISRGQASSTGLLTDEYMFADSSKTATGSERLGSSTYRRSANTAVIESLFFLSTGTTHNQNNTSTSLNLTSFATTNEDLTPATYNTGTTMYLGSIATISVFANQKISEIFFFSTNKTDDRNNIRNNMNNFYSAY